MAKGSSDIILRDRLQFDIDASGDTALVYGRVDFSDYVSIPENKGLAIKEIRFQLRTTTGTVGAWPLNMLANNIAADARADLKIFATTTAYENANDVGIASPNVISIMELQSTYATPNTTLPPADRQQNLVTRTTHYGTPDLHPEGYDVVTDLLIGIVLNDCNNAVLTDTTAELDVMIICEPKKITQKDLTQMLTQAQDL